MPDLGKYADTVFSAYAVSLVLIVVLVTASVLRARKLKQMLNEVEARGHRDG